MGGGKIDAVMKCTDRGHGPDHDHDRDLRAQRLSNEDVDAVRGHAGPASGMSMKMRVDAKRVGECDGRRTLNRPRKGERETCERSSSAQPRRALLAGCSDDAAAGAKAEEVGRGFAAARRI